MKILDLFAGIGVASLAAETVWPGIEHEFVEINPFCQTILKKHFPNSLIHDDIKSYRPAGTVDLVWGSPPCQAASQAGKQKGTADYRWLWPDTFRVIREARPRFWVLENVYGLLSLEGGLVFDSLLAEMENMGYGVQPFIVPACAVNAPHRRDRIWIIGYSNVCGQYGRNKAVDTTEDWQQTFGNIERRHTQFSGNVADTQGVFWKRAKPKRDRAEQSKETLGNSDSDTPYSDNKGLEGHGQYGECTDQCATRKSDREDYGWGADGLPDWDCIFYSVMLAPAALCSSATIKYFLFK